MEKNRLDVYLFITGLAESREKAKKLISNKMVYVNNNLITKPSLKIDENSTIYIKNTDNYVGRGASKLEKALDVFSINVTDKISVDVGASTGGFTDILLKKGALKVYSIDVGHDQLHEKLRNNQKVINLEGINFRYIDIKLFKEYVDIIAVDVSFISLKLILPKIVEISHINTDIIVLIKPQFEAGKGNVGKNGVVKDKKIHLVVLNNFNEYCKDNGLYINNITFSPIKGGNGNIEYLAYLKKISKTNSNFNFRSLINEAFDLL
ncbi:TlyA family RNA methyltransferase [Sedimentibacter sp. MB31-C6]|uniref:TlyA family RNA methyltransferase n=1 Tax=Sedimentibacter sp. MB31-C6 TaxID=3109366 RepID=UPI002DDDA688|nr:TlyA family RNA methyltransferase [Sedimentibacter sp. MB36-C1]WSI04192.1 TlyA family RNA methyltransferase [Sedimentibacter sp. MB36-C1]WSI05643.1 TlyA family RNA methyltransferase [Sedimentibacter sp. MB36-C1]